MKNRFLRPAPATLVVACALAAPAAVQAAPASVQLRIEGRNTTIFEGPVTSDGHVVRPVSGDNHACDGTNGGRFPTPGPTPTSTLDDGTAVGGFTWDGQYDTGFEDYLIDRVGPDPTTASEFWGVFVNWTATDFGGCQVRVKTFDEVLWAFDAFSKQHALRLAGPSSGTTGQPVGVRVTDGADGAPLAGAGVGGKLTGADGRATLTFDEKGIYRLKATRADSVRSNALVVCVDPPGAAPCTSTDKTAPRVTLRASGALATELGNSRTLRFSWQGDDPAGSGVTGYSVDVAEVSGAGVKASADVFKNLVRTTLLTRTRYRGAAGSSYRFRVTAVDRATNRASFDSGVISIPVDDRDKVLKVGRGWKRLHRNGAWGRSVIRSRRNGSAVKLRFRGRRVALIGRRLRKGGRLRVKVDGRSRVVSLRGRPRFKSVLFTSRRLRAGGHSLRVRTLGGGPVELDAVAPLP